MKKEILNPYLEFITETAYLLDGGRVLALTLDSARPSIQLLGPGDMVAGVRVLEPLDLAADGHSLLVLDRAGDVYRYDAAVDQWALERYDRPAGSSYDHFYTAMAASTGIGSPPAGYLLETTHEQVWRFGPGQKGSPWIVLPQGRDVDLSVNSTDLYLLSRAMTGPTGSLALYRDGSQVAAFRPDVALTGPRQVVAVDAAVYVLDQMGRRVLKLDPGTGALLTAYQFTDRRAVNTMWASPEGGQLILAGDSSLYFLGAPSRRAQVEGEAAAAGPQPHDPGVLEELRGLSMPIAGASATSRDFQMPGAPRHYRLGVHEGTDFYGDTVGVPVSRSTPVLAVADGVVVRALVDYQALTAAESAAWAEESQRLGYTPPEILDGYRGRQVWIDHGGGLVSRYAHLATIAPGVVEGAQVARGELIGTVGNSGTPSSIGSEEYDAHLHLELWIGDYYVGQFLRPIETREWLERILR